MINLDNFSAASNNWMEAEPFPHFVVDNFFANEVAADLEADFPDFDSEIWATYGNAIEIKKLCNKWDAFPPKTYRAFQYLNSPGFVDYLSKTLLDDGQFYADSGLNGGGWHIHSRGKLTRVLTIHFTKLALQRKLNIIVYKQLAT